LLHILSQLGDAKHWGEAAGNSISAEQG